VVEVDNESQDNAPRRWLTATATSNRVVSDMYRENCPCNG
jgi:hypothetical protein